MKGSVGCRGCCRREPLLVERREQRRAISCTRFAYRLLELGCGIQLQLAPEIDVPAVPEAAQGRHVVGRDGGEGAAHEFVGPPEPSAVLLEQQHLVVIQTEFSHRPAHLVGHHAQILADDHAGAARALQHEIGEQLVQRIMHVGSVDRRTAGGHPPQPEQRHHVIQP